MKTKKSFLWLAFLILATIWILARRNQKAEFNTASGFVFGTVYKIAYQHDADLKPEIEAELKRFDQSLSPFTDSSVISRINRNEELVTDSFFQSYNDLSQLLDMSRQDVLRTIEKLVKGKFIRKKKIRTRVGDFTDNTYTVCIYVHHSRIKKASRRASRRQGIHCFTMNTPIKNTSSLYNKSSALSIGFKKKMRLLEIFFLKRGSG